MTATLFELAALRTFGYHRDAFWNSERDAEKRAREKYRGWTYRVEPEKENA